MKKNNNTILFAGVAAVGYYLYTQSKAAAQPVSTTQLPVYTIPVTQPVTTVPVVNTVPVVSAPVVSTPAPSTPAPPAVVTPPVSIFKSLLNLAHSVAQSHSILG